MPLITRQLSNTGAPLYSPAGTLLAGVTISFTLVDETSAVTDAFDVVSGERVFGKVTAVTDINGIFTVNLWPNDRGDKITKYVCSIAKKDMIDFSSQVPSGIATLTWYDFKHNGTILSPAEITELNVHIADATKHLTSGQNALLDGLSPLIAGNSGFVDKSKVTLSWSNVTRTLTLTPIGSFSFYHKGTPFTKTVAESIQIPNTMGNVYVYYNELGVLATTPVMDIGLLEKFVFVAVIYWNTTLQKAVPDAFEQLHSCYMDAPTYLYHHSCVGTSFASGIIPTVNASGSGNALADIQVAVTSGIIFDADNKHLISSRIASDNIPVVYRLGTSEWSFDNSSSAIVRTTGTGRAAYNQDVGGVWQLTEVPNSDYVLSHLYAIPGITTKYLIMMGTATYTSAALAREAARVEITKITDPQILNAKLIATFVIQTANTYTNAVKSRIQQTISGSEDFVDWRYVTTIAGVPSHY